MPRAQGQVDLAKTEAILNAAGDIFSAQGLWASIDDVARRARVSKQTIYNRDGSKAELIRAMIVRRVNSSLSPLREVDPNASVEQTLTAWARSMLAHVVYGHPLKILRVTIQAAGQMPDLARMVFEYGPMASRKALAEYLETEVKRGRLEMDDPMEAADFYAGMVVTSRQIAALMGLDPVGTEEMLLRVSGESARRFVRAYAPSKSAAT